MREEEGIRRARGADNEMVREGEEGGRVAELIWAVKLLQWVGGQWFGHTATDFCSVLQAISKQPQLPTMYAMYNPQVETHLNMYAQLFTRFILDFERPAIPCCI